MAMIEMAALHVPLAARHLEKAIGLAPEVREAWRFLGQLYAATGEQKKRAALEEAYRQRFAEPL